MSIELPRDDPTKLQMGLERLSNGLYVPRWLACDASGAARVSDINDLIEGYEVAEIPNVTTTRGTVVFSGLKAARMWLRDEGASVVTKLYFCINAADAAEADLRLANANARMILRIGEVINSLPFDAYDPVIRIDYIANIAETGANLLYIEGKA